MISLSIGEGYAFDFLSICEVKLSYAKTKDDKARMAAQFKFYANLIEEQVGGPKYGAVRASIEYAKLKDTNKTIFDTINNAKIYTINALTVDSLNIVRFKLKQEIQRKFFPDKPLNECKLGYKFTK